MAETDNNFISCGGELAGRIALVTGASRGIGRGIAQKLASLGATVLLNYKGSQEQAEALETEITQKGGLARCVGCDVSDFTACGAMVEQIIKQYGRVDILVNNAGVTRDNLIMRMSEEDYDRVLDTNLKGAFNTIRHLSRYFLIQRSGKIVNISSVSGVLGNAGQANYSASKAGLIGLTKSVARELASRGTQMLYLHIFISPAIDQIDHKARRHRKQNLHSKYPAHHGQTHIFGYHNRKHFIRGR